VKVIILAGGFGTRLSEYTEIVPKPMVAVGGRPIIWHIMNTYAKYKYVDFNLALGYKAETIKDYFLNYRSLNSDFTIDLSNGSFIEHQNVNKDWKVTLIDTGLHSMTGGRVKRMKDFIGDETFLLTYGDGLSDINIDDLVDFHKSHGKMVTLTAVRPTARFGELDLHGDTVASFKEKPQKTQGWINGGYFVIEPEFFDFILNDSTILEQEPLEKVAQMGELMSYKHDGFWQCMDSKRDRDNLEDMWALGNAPWAI
jgi:glucose-1-phosphate cytidylyltransferase